MSALRENAIMSIQAGVEDLQAKTQTRTLSGIRNLHAGVILLLKEKLRQLSPAESNEVLLRRRVREVKKSDGNVTLIGCGTETVNVHETIQRLTDRGIQGDWQRIHDLTEQRNHIEHYAATVSHDALRAVAADVFIVIRDFAGELGEDPRVMLGEKTWKVLLENEEVFQAERKSCVDQISSIDWESGALEESMLKCICNSCGSPLVTVSETDVEIQEMSIVCRSCGGNEAAGSFVPRTLDHAFSRRNYISVKEGCDPLIATCPHCEEDAFVVDEDRCALCRERRQYTNCLRCNAELSVDDQDLGGSCSYCAHIASKND